MNHTDHSPTIETVVFDFMKDPIVGCSWQLQYCRFFRVQLAGWVYVPGQAARRSFQEFILN